jgi:hypothetical protein
MMIHLQPAQPPLAFVRRHVTQRLRAVIGSTALVGAGSVAVAFLSTVSISQL